MRGRGTAAGETRRRSRRAWQLPALAAVAFALCLPRPGAAEAVEPAGHIRLGTITVGFPKAEPLKDACGLALGPGGRVYVSNYYEHAVYVFVPASGSGYEFVARLEVPEPPLAPSGKPFDGPCDLALDSAGNLYVNNWHANVVRFAPTAPGALTYGPGVVIDSDHSTGVAVDPADDHVFVDDRTPEEGSFVAEYGPVPAEGTPPVRRIGLEAIGDGYSVAVSAFHGAAGFPSTAGRVYVADAADGTVEAFDPAMSLTEPVQTIDGEGTSHGGFNHLADTDLAVDPRDGHLYVVDNLEPGFERPEAVVDEFSSLGHYRGPIPSGVATGHPSELIDAEPTSVAISAAGEVFLTSGNYFDDNTIHQDSQVQVFGPAAVVPTQTLAVTKSGGGEGTVFSSDPAGLRCGTACESEFPLERTIVLVAEPAPHNRFAGWSGCPDVLANGRCALTLTAGATVDAEFEPVPTHTLSVAVGGAGQGSVASAPAGIDCGSACSGEFDGGSEVTLTATALDGSFFAGWRGEGCDSEPAPGACTVTMAAARSVAAEFEPVPVPPVPPLPIPPARTLSVATTGLGGATGSVSSSPGGIDCGATCAGLYADGTTVTLEARPAAGSAFVGWGGCDRTDGVRCTVGLGADKVVVAAFGPAAPAAPRVRGVSVRGATATLRVAVPAAGELSAGSPRVQPASVLPIQAGIVSLRVKLNPRGVRALAGSKRHRLTVKVTLRFTPFEGGGTSRAVPAVTFGTAPASRSRR